MIIGITGGSGGGKTTVSAYFKDKGYEIIDADAVAHQVMAAGTPCLEEVADFFGRQYIMDNGMLDRKKLGALVFSDPALLEALNGITYRYITEAVRRKMEGKTNVVIDAVGLFESGLDRFCDQVLFVSAPPEVRRARIMARDHISPEYAQARIDAQKEDGYYRSRCNFEIENDGQKDVRTQLEGLDFV